MDAFDLGRNVAYKIDKMISFDVKQVYSVANILFFTIIYYIYL